MTARIDEIGDRIFRLSVFVPEIAPPAPAIRKLAGLAPRKLAVMHGSSFTGDAATALHSLAGEYDRRLRRALGERMIAA